MHTHIPTHAHVTTSLAHEFQAASHLRTAAVLFVTGRVSSVRTLHEERIDECGRRGAATAADGGIVLILVLV